MATLSCKPAFVHDCADCAFVCHAKPVRGAAFDLYRSCGGEGDLIARTGSQGADYHYIDALIQPHINETDSVVGRAIWLARREEWIKGLMAL